MQREVNIFGIDRVELLKELWLAREPAIFFSMYSPQFDEKQAVQALNGYIDYFCGRCIKTDLSGMYADPSLYDRDAYPGAFADIVKKVRDKIKN